jgi:hypothetical protein
VGKFFAGQTTDQIAEWVNGELQQRGINRKFSRQQVYPVIFDAAHEGLIRYYPPEHVQLAADIASKTDVTRDQVQVVNTHGPEGTEHLAAVAADVIIDLIRRAARRKGGSKKRPVSVHLGLGAGYTTLQIVRQLAIRLRDRKSIDGVSELVFHALSSGFDPNDPQTSPVAFFTYFDELPIRTEFYCLFTEAVVVANDLDRVKQLPGVRQSFAAAKDIDIVVTSLASASDRGALLNRFEDQYAELNPARSQSRDGRVGDVHFRPYSKKGPIETDSESIRAVTLFELEDFVTMTQEEGKYVVLVAGTTRRGGNRAKPLLPLLTEPTLRVWSHLCLDVSTAREVARKL